MVGRVECAGCAYARRGASLAAHSHSERTGFCSPSGRKNFVGADWRRQAARRFATPTDGVAAEMFLATTRIVLFDQTAASSSMNRVDDASDACSRSPARAPFTVTSSSDVWPAACSSDAKFGVQYCCPNAAGV